MVGARPVFAVLEDCDLIMRVIRRAIAPFGDVQTADTIASFQSMMPVARRFTALLIDVRLPDGSGLDVLRAVRAEPSAIPALVMTAFDDTATVAAAFDLHARLLLKSGRSDGEMFDVRIETFAREVTTSDTESLGQMLDAWTDRYGLTPAERAIVAAAANELTFDQIAMQRQISAGTLKVHVKHILAKTGDRGLVHCALRFMRDTWKHQAF